MAAGQPHLRSLAARLARAGSGVTQGKTYATLGMAVGYAVLVGAHPSWPLALGVGLFFIASAAYVLSRPSPRAQAPSGGPDDA